MTLQRRSIANSDKSMGVRHRNAGLGCLLSIVWKMLILHRLLIHLYITTLVSNLFDYKSSYFKCVCKHSLSVSQKGHMQFTALSHWSNLPQTTGYVSIHSHFPDYTSAKPSSFDALAESTASRTKWWFNCWLPTDDAQPSIVPSSFATR